ncbi:MAG: hypothetical protein NVSMB55_02880 [Mycobacteriales bacterium]
MRSDLLPLAVATLVLALAGCTPTHSSGVVAAPPVPSVAAPVSPPVSPPGSPLVDASPSDSPTPFPSPTRAAAPTYDVRAVQQQLTGLHYYAGALDGTAGPAFASAVMAFQKVQGVGADGVIGAGTLAALKAPRTPSLRGSSPADRVEVDLTRQVLYVVQAGAIARILPVSSGNGATYLQKNGREAKALSPVGYYRIERRIIGPQKADLGTLYDPQYFYRGWAIHGSDSVPAYPASHGCIRVTRADATYLLQAIGVGTSVYLYGGRYTFAAGSSAPGTDSPTGDTPSGTAPSTAPPSPAPPSQTPSPTASSSPSAQPSPAPPPASSPRPSGTGGSTPKASASPSH